MHQALHHALADKRFSWFSRHATGDIVLVAIDPPSIDKIGVWPWPRRLHAELIGQLEYAKASDIVFDVDFSSPSNSSSDEAFRAALQKAGGSVVLPSFKQIVEIRGAAPTMHVNRPLPSFADHAWSAMVNVTAEPDGLVRSYLFGDAVDGKQLPSVGSMLAGTFDKNSGSFLIDFSIQTNSVPTVSYADVLRGDPATLSKLKGKKVIIGASAIELGDRFNVPNGRIMSGAMLQILAAETIAQGRVLLTTSHFVTLGGLGFIALLMLLLWRRLSAARRVVVLVGMTAAIETTALLLQAQYAVMLDTSLFHVAIAAYLAAMALDEIDFRSLLGLVAEKRFQRIAMSLGDGLVCADRNGLITVWNPGAVAIFGYNAHEMIGQPFGRICVKATGADPAVPFSITELSGDLLQSPGGHVMELEGCRKNGGRFPLEACFSGWQGTDGFQYGAVLRDVSVRKREAERIRYLAEFDTLTGLANRNTLHERMGTKLTKAMAEGSQVALLLMDLDKFKEINDTLGHACGDQVLCAVAEQLKRLAQADDVVARLSGDEFSIVISGFDAAERAAVLAEQIRRAFDATLLSVGIRQIRVKGSIGVAIYPVDCDSAEELLGNADLALYRAKSDGRGRHVFFDRTIRNALEARLSLEVELRDAINKQELELFYQPQVSLRDGKLIGAEALIRWRHPVRGLVSPADFMPIVNASSFSDRIALWVMETACRQGRAWQRTGHDVRIGINLSPSQFQSGDLAATVARVLAETGLSPSLLELEVTEDILLEDDARALDIFRRIQDLGVLIAFDDFGTGFASLSYLKKFPLNGLKIDQSFVRDMRPESDDAAIVSSTVSLGKLLGLTVIAEGIEDQAAADLLLGMGCEQGQGYHFGRPMPVAEFEAKFLLKGRDAPAVDAAKIDTTMIDIPMVEATKRDLATSAA
jgi:diguanylate cyclase (GGDEF)-like protein/PAS domain S-box-containing protein